jgi:hypothetical protein
MAPESRFQHAPQRKQSKLTALGSDTTPRRRNPTAESSVQRLPTRHPTRPDSSVKNRGREKAVPRGFQRRSTLSRGARLCPRRYPDIFDLSVSCQLNSRRLARVFASQPHSIGSVYSADRASVCDRRSSIRLNFLTLQTRTT